jgi:hypothetical protein
MARNEYPGKCYRCGLEVPAGTGHFERHQGQWRVRHHDFSRADTLTCTEAEDLHLRPNKRADLRMSGVKGIAS